MAKPNRTVTHAKQSAPPLVQQRQIAQQTADFLAKGGAIQQIPNGVSGQAKLGGPSLSNAPAKAP